MVFTKQQMFRAISSIGFKNLSFSVKLSSHVVKEARTFFLCTHKCVKCWFTLTKIDLLPSQSRVALTTPFAASLLFPRKNLSSSESTIIDGMGLNTLKNMQAVREKNDSVQGHDLTFRFTGIDAAWETQSCESPILKEYSLMLFRTLLPIEDCCLRESTLESLWRD